MTKRDKVRMYVEYTLGMSAQAYQEQVINTTRYGLYQLLVE